MIRPDEWSPVGIPSLESNAERAVRSTSSVAVMAGPGAGKSELLAQRADFLLRTGTCPYPMRILAVSFKRDAARNLKHRVELRCGKNLAGRFDSLTFHAFAKGLLDRFIHALPPAMRLSPDYSINSNVKIEGQVIDFTDLVIYARAILEENVLLRDAMQSSYSHVFLDEFQDCNKEQYQLIRTAFGNSNVVLTAVGDTKQRIMGWAGALEGVFQDFASDFAADPLNLYQNFRSLPDLRRIQNVFIRRIDPAGAQPDENIEGTGGECHWRVFADDTEETKWVADLISQRIALGVPKHEIAVLTRNHSAFYSMRLCSELASRGIEARDEHKLQDLVAEEAVGLLIEFLSVVLTDPGAETYHRLTSTVAGLFDETSEAEARDFRVLRGVAELVEDWRRRIDVARPEADQINAALDDLVEMVGADRLRGLSIAYQRGDFLSQLVEQTKLVLAETRSQVSDWRATLRSFGKSDNVSVLSIHKSKGLEWDTVVLLGVENEAFFGFRDEPEEEISGLFVGLSRAKAVVAVTSCMQRTRPLGFAKRWDERRSLELVMPFFEILDEAGVSCIVSPAIAGSAAF